MARGQALEGRNGRDGKTRDRRGPARGDQPTNDRQARGAGRADYVGIHRSNGEGDSKVPAAGHQLARKLYQSKVKLETIPHFNAVDANELLGAIAWSLTKKTHE